MLRNLKLLDDGVHLKLEKPHGREFRDLRILFPLDWTKDPRVMGFYREIEGDVGFEYRVFHQMYSVLTGLALDSRTRSIYSLTIDVP